MREAYRLTARRTVPLARRRDGGGDDQANLEANLLDLLDRICSGRYHAPPVRRAYIPKADGTQRPLGIPTFEDKVAQRAVAMVLEAIYEQDFLPCSYGFRLGRSAHQALDALRAACMGCGGRSKTRTPAARSNGCRVPRSTRAAGGPTGRPGFPLARARKASRPQWATRDPTLEDAPGTYVLEK